MPENDQILMGVIISLLSLIGIFKTRWLASHSTKGKKLVARLGEEKAHRIIRGFLILGSLFGILLATGVINPIQWE